MLRSALRNIFKGSSAAKPAASVAAAPTASSTRSSVAPTFGVASAPPTARAGPVTAAVRPDICPRCSALTLCLAGCDTRGHRTATTLRLGPAAQARRPLADRPSSRLPAPARRALWRAGRECARHARQRAARGPRAERCVLALPSSLARSYIARALSCPLGARADDSRPPRSQAQHVPRYLNVLLLSPSRSSAVCPLPLSCPVCALLPVASSSSVLSQRSNVLLDLAVRPRPPRERESSRLSRRAHRVPSPVAVRTRPYPSRRATTSE